MTPKVHKFFSCLLLTTVAVGAGTAQNLSPNHSWNFDNITNQAAKSTQGNATILNTPVANLSPDRVFVLPAVNPRVMRMKAYNDSLAPLSLLPVINKTASYSSLKETANAAADKNAPKIVGIDTQGKLVLDQNLWGMDDAGAIKSKSESEDASVLFHVPTAHYNKIVITYEISLSGSPSQYHYVYSKTSDGGLNWKTTGLMNSPPPKGNTIIWKLVSFDFGSDEATVDGSSNVYRISFDTEKVLSSQEENSKSESNLYALYPNPANSLLNVSTSENGTNNIKVCNIMGQVLQVVEKSENRFSLDISTLPAGYYFLNIINSATGNNSKLSFVKE